MLKYAWKVIWVAVCAPYIPRNVDTTALTEGWYLASGDVVLTERVAVSGNVVLVLADGASLTAEKGLEVTAPSHLVITAQSTDEGTMGRLTAGAEASTAAIGGSSQAAAGDITIAGGNISATGGSNAAGIGASYGGYDSAANDAGTIRIDGVDITATGGNGGAGIQGETITISGGTVTATGSTGPQGSGAGIGSSNGKLIIDLQVTISGGTVTAIGGEGAPDIGDRSPDSQKFSTGENGAAVIHADNINGQSGVRNWSCRVYSLDGSSLTIYVDYTLTEDMTVEAGRTLTFFHDSSSSQYHTLTVPEGVTLSVCGTFNNQSKAVKNNGSILIYKGGVCPTSSSNGNYILFETDYLDDNGQTQTVWARQITNGSGSISESGWYVVNGDLTAWPAVRLCRHPAPIPGRGPDRRHGGCEAQRNLPHQIHHTGRRGKWDTGCKSYTRLCPLNTGQECNSGCPVHHHSQGSSRPTAWGRAGSSDRTD